MRRYRDYDSPRVGDSDLGDFGPGLTQQHFAEACDINRIMARHDLSAILEAANAVKAEFGDFSNAGDYRDAMEVVCRAQDAFDAMPAEVRKRFRNDPIEMCRFLEVEANREEAVKLGLMKPRVKNSPENADKVGKGGDSGVDKGT